MFLNEVEQKRGTLHWIVKVIEDMGYTFESFDCWFTDDDDSDYEDIELTSFYVYSKGEDHNSLGFTICLTCDTLQLSVDNHYLIGNELPFDTRQSTIPKLEDLLEILL